MVNTSAQIQTAPGQLEDVRVLLNSWLIPNDTRVAEDRFDTYADQHGVLARHRDSVRQLRDDLRTAVDRDVATADVLNGWIERLDLRPQVTGDTIGYRHDAGLLGGIVATCLEAVASGQWPRLKACPDCRWVFYDHSRNGSKRWCLMTAGGPDGRSCGSIAKVRAHRERARRA